MTLLPRLLIKNTNVYLDGRVMGKVRTEVVDHQVSRCTAGEVLANADPKKWAFLPLQLLQPEHFSSIPLSTYHLILVPLILVFPFLAFLSLDAPIPS